MAVYHEGCCQVKMNGPPKNVEPASSSRKLMPLGKGGGAVEFEVFATVEVPFLVEVIVDRSVDRGEFL